jgi:clan AA aspartic protease
MGLCYAELTIGNARKTELSPIIITAMADTGALHLCIPQHVVMQLQLEELEKREVTLADGSKQLLPYVGPIHLRFGNRSGFMGAMVLGDEVLLGAIPMEDLDLVVHPASRTVTVNPLNPNFPASVVKGIKVKFKQ